MNEQEKLALIMHLAACQRCRERAELVHRRCRTPFRLGRLTLRRAVP